MANQEDEIDKLRQDVTELHSEVMLLRKALMEPMPVLQVDRLEFVTEERILTRHDTGTDLGAILGPLTAQHRRVKVTFDPSGADGDLEFIWNEPFRVPAYHELTIEGPYSNNPAEADLRVRIKMDRNQTVDRPPTFMDARNPTRAVVSERAQLVLRGLRIHENANDARQLARTACEGGALLNIDGDFGAIVLEQSYINSTEDVIGFGTRAFGRVLLGHTHFSRPVDAIRSILAVRRYTGWCFAGAGGMVSSSHTHLGEGVAFEQTPSILYLP